MAANTRISVTGREAVPFGAKLRATLPPGAAGQWCSISLGLRPGAPWWAKLELTDEARGHVVREVFLGPARIRGCLVRRHTLVHVPRDAYGLVIDLFTASAGLNSGPAPALQLRILTRAQAAASLLWRGWRSIPAALAGSPRGAVGRLRATLGQAPARAGEAPSYATWIALFEPPPTDAAIQAAREWDMQIVVVAGAPEATAASLAAASGQWPPSAPILIQNDADWAAITAPWIVLLEAGEILAPGAIAAFALLHKTAPWAEILTADCDRLDPSGARADPLFKPGPDRLLLASGLPTRGACALRWRNVPASLPRHAAAVRLAFALQNSSSIAHVPKILSHIRPDCRPSELVRQTATLETRQILTAACCPSVTILVPTAGRAAHIAPCIAHLVKVTDYPNYKVKMVLSAMDRARPSVLRALCRSPLVAIEPVRTGAFNYAVVNNAAAATAQSELLLLLNDDVAPINADWLSAMVAHMDDPGVGIVGARLLYGNGRVQHEGVIMGLANLCEHAGRLRAGTDAGPHGIGLLDRQVSAVTGACLLIRAALYRDLGGMDGAYAIALNDVDLCLRAREAGFAVVYCAGAELHHYESLSLGRHYAGPRAARESVEVQRLRRRFAGVIADDPFYSPLASLQPGREWQPAFPPRPHTHAAAEGAVQSVDATPHP